jgi:hypothetical protein
MYLHMHNVIAHKTEKLLSHMKADLHTNMRRCEQQIGFQSVRMLIGQMAPYSE